MTTLNRPTTVDTLSGLSGQEWLAQRKLDGVRLAVVWGADGRPSHAITKGGQEVAAPHGLPDMPAGTVVDGELVADDWESALSELAAGRPGRWIPFDLAAYPTPVGGLLARLDVLRGHGLTPLEAGPVETVWERVLYDGGEGIVVRSAQGPYSAPAFKIKPQREFVAIAHRGFLHVLGADGKPEAVGRCADTARGLVLVGCEGATKHGNVRAPRILSVAPPGATASAKQLERLFIR